MKEQGAYSTTEATTYDTDRETEALWHIENDYVRALVAGAGASSVLDAPVGTGRFLDFYGDAAVTGIDLSDAMLEEAGKRVAASGLSNVALLQCSVTELPFPDGQFDLVVSWRLFHLLPPEDVTTALRELARVCQGRLCVQFYEQASLQTRLLSKAKRWLRRLSLVVGQKRQLTPWSHIRSYAHTRGDIERAAAAARIGMPAHRDQLGDYEGTRVMAYVWNLRG